MTILYKLPIPALCLAILLAAMPLPSDANNLASQLPDIGDAGGTVLSASEEKQLGLEFMRNIRQNLDLVDDPITTAYLQNIADKLQPKSGDIEQNITIFIVNDPTINAFAGPGGYIGVHTGLILAARKEGELAAVLAHEMAHVLQRHLARTFETNSKMSLSTLGAIIAALVLGSHNPQASQAVIASSVAGNAQQQLTFSRSHEQEADRVGLELLASAGYDPRMMVSFFEVLQQQQRAQNNMAPEFLQTHPLTLSRIADARNRAEQYPKFPPEKETAFQLIQARMAVLTDETESNPFTNNGRTITDVAKQYYQALVAAKSNDYPKARKLLARLLHDDPRRLIFPYTAAQIELNDNHPDKARLILKRALTTFPGNPLLTELNAKALLELNKAQMAYNTLKTAINRHPKQLYLYQTYAKAASRMGNNVEGYHALAEYQYALGNVRQAIDYLQQALDLGTADKFDRLSIEARLKELKKEAMERDQSNGKKDDSGHFFGAISKY
jgi:predicted Zn-dependent protease